MSVKDTRVMTRKASQLMGRRALSVFDFLWLVKGLRGYGLGSVYVKTTSHTADPLRSLELHLTHDGNIVLELETGDDHEMVLAV